MSNPEYVLGFKALADQIPEIVGQPIESEHHDSPNGDGLQATTRGLMVWRKADNWTAFTDGYRTWINGPFGLQERLNSERFDWELPAARPILIRDIVPLLPVAPWNLCPKRATSRIEMIVVHWDGPKGPVQGYDPLSWYQWEARYHIAKDWGDGAHGYGLMYHECMSRDARVWLTRPATHEVWAATGANPIAYNLKADSGANYQATGEQLATLPRRLDALREQYGVRRDQVFGHGELTDYGNQTECPGPALLDAIRQYREQ